MSDEVQPNGVSIERTLDVVGSILADEAFAQDVAVHNGWGAELSQERVAILFLAFRFQWAVDLLSRRTATLNNKVDEAINRAANLEG